MYMKRQYDTYSELKKTVSLAVDGRTEHISLAPNL